MRKAKELFLSFELEKKYSKDQILEMYLNNAISETSTELKMRRFVISGKSAKD